MSLKSFNVILPRLLMSALALGAISVPKVLAQGATDQAVLQEEQQMMQSDKSQEVQLEQQKQAYQQEISQDEQRREPYRLYAEQRIEQLNKLKTAGGSPSRALTQQKSGEMYALEKWLAADEASRQQEQARMNQLDQAITNLQQAQNETMQNMNSDLQTMREDSQRQADAQKFNQMMAVNHYNELKSEMGAASWGRPPTDGTFNSTGGYGFGGGYGYRGFARGGGF